MHADSPHTVFADRETLSQVEHHLLRLVRDAAVSSAALIDRSGALLAAAGDLPAPEDQIGATAAGVFGAICSVFPPIGTPEFTIDLPFSHVFLHFRGVDERLFFCVCLSERPAADQLVALAAVADEARNLFAAGGTDKPSAQTLQAIAAKIDELFPS
jgi:hypothetical protein